jgi:hypothetical protein
MDVVSGGVGGSFWEMRITKSAAAEPKTRSRECDDSQLPQLQRVNEDAVEAEETKETGAKVSVGKKLCGRVGKCSSSVIDVLSAQEATGLPNVDRFVDGLMVSRWHNVSLRSQSRDSDGGRGLVGPVLGCRCFAAEAAQGKT